MKAILVGLAGFVAASSTSHAQSVVQNLNISLTVYNQGRPLHISTRDIIRYFVGTNMPGGKLLLVMPRDPSPDSGSNGNMGAFLRVTGSDGSSMDVSSPISFNVYQTSSSATAGRVYAYNQFSIDFGQFHAELFGLCTWTRTASSPGGQGSFHGTVGGYCIIDDVTSDNSPCNGSITGGATRPDM